MSGDGPVTKEITRNYQTFIIFFVFNIGVLLDNKTEDYGKFVGENTLLYG